MLKIQLIKTHPLCYIKLVTRLTSTAKEGYFRHLKLSLTTFKKKKKPKEVDSQITMWKGFVFFLLLHFLRRNGWHEALFWKVEKSVGYITAKNVRSTPKQRFKERPFWDSFIICFSDNVKWEYFKGHWET